MARKPAPSETILCRWANPALFTSYGAVNKTRGIDLSKKRVPNVLFANCSDRAKAMSEIELLKAEAKSVAIIDDFGCRWDRE